MAFITDTRAGGLTLGQRIAALRTQMTEAAEKRRVYRTTLRELEQLNNRDLADLGISRSSIKRLAYEAAYES